MARVVDGEVIETRRLLMRPPSSCDWFDGFNIGLHGITPEMVKGEPRFRDRLRPRDRSVGAAGTQKRDTAAVTMHSTASLVAASGVVCIADPDRPGTPLPEVIDTLRLAASMPRSGR